jgi:glutathione S-transferase
VVSPKFLGREGDLALADMAAKDEYPPLVDYVETIIPESGFLVEDRLTLADLAVASPFVNFAHCGIHIDAARNPKTAAYVEGILSRPSFAGVVAGEKAFLAR